MKSFFYVFQSLKQYLWKIITHSMSQDTVKRFHRIVAILIQLQSKKTIKAQELADRFEVSLRTVYRDIRTLESCGVPIISEAGVGYSIMEGYRLPPIMFTKEEASSFVAAEKLMQQFTDSSLGSYHQSAMYKIKSVLRGKEKEFISALESKVSITTRQELFNKNVPNALDVLFDCIAEKKQVALTYQSLQSNAPTQRSIEPVGIFHENGFWYVMGYCHLRQDYRQFRTDRIYRIENTNHPYSVEHPPLETLRNTETDHPKVKVRIRVDNDVVRYIKAERNHYGFVSEKQGKKQTEMTFMTHPSDHGFPRWYIMFGDYAEILEPETLKEQVRKIIHTMKKRL